MKKPIGSGHSRFGNTNKGEFVNSWLEFTQILRAVRMCHHTGVVYNCLCESLIPIRLCADSGLV